MQSFSFCIIDYQEFVSFLSQMQVFKLCFTILSSQSKLDYKIHNATQFLNKGRQTWKEVHYPKYMTILSSYKPLYFLVPYDLARLLWTYLNFHSRFVMKEYLQLYYQCFKYRPSIYRPTLELKRYSKANLLLVLVLDRY